MMNKQELETFNKAMERLYMKTEEMWIEADQEGHISFGSAQIEGLLEFFEAHSKAVNSLFYAKNNLKQLESVFNQLIPTEEFLNRLSDNGTQDKE